jgi:hypothetical protein
MTKGTMGIIGCPMLEDELIYDLKCDKDEKTIYLTDTGPASSLRRKFDRYGIGYKIVDEFQFWHGIDGLDPAGYNIVILMNSLGLHTEPKELKAKIEDQVTMLQSRFDVLMLFYGLCGNYGWDISAWAKEKYGTEVTVFRDEDGKVCDDCIGVAVGGTKPYCKLIRTYTGMLLLTPCMATNWNDFLSCSEMMRGCDPGDHSMMRMILEMCGYEKAVKIDTGLGDPEDFQRCADDLCKEMNLKLITAEKGWTDLSPSKKIYEESKAIMAMKGSL